jgi:hypothetical protein
MSCLNPCSSSSNTSRWWAFGRWQSKTEMGRVVGLKNVFKATSLVAVVNLFTDIWSRLTLGSAESPLVRAALRLVVYLRSFELFVRNKADSLGHADDHQDLSFLTGHIDLPHAPSSATSSVPVSA